MFGSRSSHGVMHVVALVAVQLVLILIGAAFFTLDAVGAPEATPFGAVALPWQVLMLATAAAAVIWSGVQQVRMQVRLDRRAHYGIAALRLGEFRTSMFQARHSIDQGREMFEFGKAHGARETSLKRYMDSRVKGERALSAECDALIEFLENDPLLGPAEAEALKSVSTSTSGVAAMGEAYEQYVADLINRLAAEQRQA